MENEKIIRLIHTCIDCSFIGYIDIKDLNKDGRRCPICKGCIVQIPIFNGEQCKNRVANVVFNTGAKCNYGLTLILNCYKKELELEVNKRMFELYGSKAKIISYEEIDY